MRYIPLTTIHVTRDGKKVKPVIGVAFDFTDAEVAALAGQTPPALRRVINEERPVEAVDTGGL